MLAPKKWKCEGFDCSCISRCVWISLFWRCIHTYTDGINIYV